MLVLFWFGASFLATTALPVSERKMYYGYSLLQAVPTTQHHIDTLNALHENNPRIDFWTPIKLNHGVDFLVSPTDIAKVNAILEISGMSHEPLIENIQSSIDEEQRNMNMTNGNEDQDNTMMKPSWWCRYMGIRCVTNGNSGTSSGDNINVVGMFARHENINKWLKKMASDFRGLVVLESIGKSFEGREMIITKIGKNIIADQTNKPIIFIEAGIHAREWITPAVSVYIIDMMLKGYGRDPKITGMLDKFEWIFLPSANPDGYEYSPTGDRLWRKNRRRLNGSCFGVDLNRNFDIDFGVSGVSQSPCGKTYPGRNPFSEPETICIRNKINEIKNRVRAYLAFHCRSQKLLTSFAYTSRRTKDHDEMIRVGQNSMDALRKVHGKIYRVGPAPELMYAASGTSADWAKIKAGIKYAFTYELRAPKAGSLNTGFILSRSEIKPTAEECTVRAEGLSLPSSDYDTMMLVDNVTLSDNPEVLDTDIIIDTNDIKPGFVKLRCLHKIINDDILRKAMKQTPEGMFLSSVLIRDETVRKVLEVHPRTEAHGPCATFKSELKLEFDYLICLQCKPWPQIASEWIDRDRHNSWPSPDLIQEIVEEGCLLVPIGNPNSQERDMQWRISFSLAEKKLVHSFNQTQFVCYGLLKLFLKYVINVEVKELLCSYFLKTSLFYSIEEESIVWNKENYLFLDCFWTCLRLLMKWVRDEYCPNYFIKDNNMFEGKVCGSKGRVLFDNLFRLYNDGLDSLLLIPCFSCLSYFVRSGYIPSNTMSISNELKEFQCDVELFKTIFHTFILDLNASIKLNSIISSMMQQPINSTVSALLSLMMFRNSAMYILPLMFKATQTTTSHKSRYRQIRGLKQFIKNNCMVGDVCTGRLLLATLCYLSGQYKEVVTIVQKVLKEFKAYLLYLGFNNDIGTDHPYVDLICGKGLPLNQKLRLGVIVRIFICFTKHKFYPQEIETELVQHSDFQIACIPPVVYCNVLLFLSYYHMGCRDRMSYTLNELYIAAHGDKFITVIERPLHVAIALLQRCRHMFGN